MFNSSMDTFHFVVKVRATGWIGFGLATRAPNGMMGYDVAVSGTNNGTKYLKDYFASSFAAPPQDAQQDWMLSYFSEEQNVTTLKFYRKRDTNDTANDIAIQPGQSYYLIWAYHLSDTVTPGRFPKHSFSGSYQDYKTFGRTRPTLDDSQDYTLLDASEAGGYTQLIFERPRDTGDENDFAFTPGSEAFIIWSYSNADITNNTNFRSHSSKGWSSKKYVVVAENQPIPTKAKATALYSSFAIALSMALFHVLL
ncbi:DBH-like monooxygenase protein 1 [Acropora cervicornis]|uniref:DBH-like monooxygenase protein 1 n=1 Tax=Acropora cervicornis TaxID=6130 RepID=A0AAD9R7X1_ACRCE|nr:DBH-like monooxygenase protein 1 [Acropora cervicornis]